MESTDYACHQSSLSPRTAHVDADGRVRYVISLRDPDVRNWPDRPGWTEGSLCACWTYCAEYPSGISARLVKLDELDPRLPADTPKVDPAERKRMVAGRRKPPTCRWFVTPHGRFRLCRLSA